MSGSAGFVALTVGSISPLAAVILLVNDEIAQPAQELSLSVGIGASGLPGAGSAAEGGGKTVSAIVLATLRTRWRYKSRVLFAWSRTSLKEVSSIST